MKKTTSVNPVWKTYVNYSPPTGTVANVRTVT